MESALHSLKTNLSANWKSGLTVSLVSLPLSISLAVAANATPVMGVITAIWAGLFAALFGGSHFNVVGPTGALSGLLAMYALKYGVNVLPALAVMTGVLTLVVYFLRWDRYMVYIPSGVVHGFTLGVAFTIALNQLNFAVGLTGLAKHETLVANVWESILNFGRIDYFAFALFAVGVVALFALLKWVKKIPAPIVVAAVGIGVGYASANGMIGHEFQTLFTKFGELEPTLAQWPSFDAGFLNLDLLKAAAAITVIAILETLISGKIADGMTKTKFDSRKESLGLALANVASGLTGGIPATAALARTALNVKSGATSRWSGIVNAVAVAVIALVLLPGFKYLPLPIVAAILVYVAIRMVEAEHFKKLFQYDKKVFWLSIVVAVITFAEDPIVGILIGASVSLLMLVNRLSKGLGEVIVNENNREVTRVFHEQADELERHGEVVVFRFAGKLTYINAQSYLETLKKLNSCHTVVLGFRNVSYIDIDGVDAVHEMVDELRGRGKKVLVAGMNEIIAPNFSDAAWYAEMKADNALFSRTTDALNSLGFAL